MKVVILQSNYIPWKGYFDLINDADIFVFYDEVKYTKNDWRNRNRICTSNGFHWLTIPIAKDAVKQKISEVKFTNNDWQSSHFDALLAYKKAPYFKQIEPLMLEVYREKEWTYLSELNHFLIKKISSLIGINTVFKDSKEFDLNGQRVDRLVSLLKQIGATEYISGPAARNYLDGQEHLFEEANIKLTYKNYSGYPEYMQLQKPFDPAVSVIDLMANVQMDQIGDFIWNWRNK